MIKKVIGMDSMIRKICLKEDPSEGDGATPLITTTNYLIILAKLV